MVSFLRIAPLLVFPLVIFMLSAFAAQGADWTHQLTFTVSTFSGARWDVSYGDLFILTTLGVLFIEIVKAVNTNATEIINHGLSMLVAVICLVLFLTMPDFTNSTFFLLTVIAFFDVAAGLAITIVAARRDLGTTA